MRINARVVTNLGASRSLFACLISVVIWKEHLITVEIVALVYHYGRKDKRIPETQDILLMKKLLTGQLNVILQVRSLLYIISQLLLILEVDRAFIEIQSLIALILVIRYTSLIIFDFFLSISHVVVLFEIIWQEGRVFIEHYVFKVLYLRTDPQSLKVILIFSKLLSWFFLLNVILEEICLLVLYFV